MVAAEDPWLAPITLGIAIYAPAAAISAALDNYVDPVLIWGGTKCDAVEGVQACTGYPPTGLILIALVVGIVGLPPVVKLVKRARD